LVKTFAELESRVDHRFSDPQLLRLALTHPSAVRRGARAAESNQRLEFLGDRVLSLTMATLLFRVYPKEDEGALSRRHAAMVRRETLAEVAAELELGAFLTIAPSEHRGGGRENPSILADALEAVIGALYLDAGFAPASRFIERHWQDRLDGMAKPPRDAKTALQEWAQGHGFELPNYELLGTEGPAHAPRFAVTVAVADFAPELATAGSKRAAEQAAAEQLLDRLEPEGEG
jgi:ribonuclease-3